MEIDLCATYGIQNVTGCKLDKRTMKDVDYGKMGAKFVDLLTGNSVHLTVRGDARDKAARYRCQEQTKYDTEVVAYKVLSDHELFNVGQVLVQIPQEAMPSGLAFD